MTLSHKKKTITKNINRVEYTKTAVVFVHGILGHPRFFDFLQEAVPDGILIKPLLLAGHGGSVRDFSNASMSLWSSQVNDLMLELKEKGMRVVVVAHSMGTLFAIENAVRGRADGLFLLNPPMSLHVTRRLLITPLKVKFGKVNDKWSEAATAAYGIADDSNLLHYVGWIPRYMELFRKIRHVNAIVDRLQIPTRVFLSAHDEMVSLKSARTFRNIKSSTVTKLNSSGHYYYSDSDRDIILKSLSRFLSEICNSVPDKNPLFYDIPS